MTGCLVAFMSNTVYPAPPDGPATVLRDRCDGETSRLDVSTSGDAGGKGYGVRLSGGTGRATRCS